MITEIEKKEIDKKYFPNGFPYKVKTFDAYSYSNSKRLEEPFENLQEYEAVVKSVRHSNGLRFFYFIKGLNENDFIKEINNQYLNYTIENTENSKHWLSLTYDLVLKGFSIAGAIDDINLRGAFIKWYNITLNELEPKNDAPALNSDTAPTEKYLGQPTNTKANDFFDFLIEYYRPEDKTQIKYVNILHYLKNDADKKHFIFRVKQSEYKILVNEKTGIDIKKFQKSERYPEEEKPIFHTLENTFLKNKTV